MACVIFILFVRALAALLPCFVTRVTGFLPIQQGCHVTHSRLLIRREGMLYQQVAQIRADLVEPLQASWSIPTRSTMMKQTWTRSVNKLPRSLAA